MEVFSFSVTAWDTEITLQYPRGLMSQSFARRFQTTVISERDWLTLATIVLFEAIVALAAHLDSGVVKMKCQSFDSNACWQKSGENVANSNDGRSEKASFRENREGGRESTWLNHRF